MGEWFINETRYESWRQSCERKGGWDLTGEGERDDKDITCPLVISALLIMPSPSSRMSPVRLSVWHWYGSTSLWHKLLLWLVINPGYRSAALTPQPPRLFTCPHMPAFPEASSGSLRFWRWPHHLIKICWLSFPEISSLAPAFFLWPWHAGVDRWWTIYLLLICFGM